MFESTLAKRLLFRIGNDAGWPYSLFKPVAYALDFGDLPHG